jgi:death-on-curing protein
MINAKKVIEFHDYIIVEEGGLPGNHGIDAIEGALARVVNRIQYEGMEDIYEIAAMYAVAIARGHVFNDANKRTALVAALTFLETEGIVIDRDYQLEEIMVDVARGEICFQELANLFYSLANS